MKYFSLIPFLKSISIKRNKLINDKNQITKRTSNIKNRDLYNEINSSVDNCLLHYSSMGILQIV